ncbi:aminoacyl-tRNA hydrolase [Hydrogenibacillus schlegelii]|uniref:Peptidyl-tRNA hydrolase n=1 Tax=Hydrogenibacillus schlegelii TaxID=1484 RepID=A0A132N2V4_HYDSH|nr:aminoacyl-tRNA hydrolase [Hydrogenibacillus schlegelii]KWX03922.1 hypothetical protein TR75_08525 [Hydrogenibacillus schlegelii]OAR04111.1 hypothetical protein SA87_06485 [Hydrogenibacillus schlegelii]
MIRLVVGLGNPGPEYARTRHNAGFWVVDALAADGVVVRRDEKWGGELRDVRFGGQRVWLLKPLTYMNRAGDAVGAVARYFGIAPEAIVVVYDDLDLPVGKIRLRLQGGHGGHNGMRSVLAALGTEKVPRLRIGIGRPPAGSVADYVLAPPRPEERAALEAAVERAREALRLAIARDFLAAMNRFNVDGPEAGR